jgi:hypothetical protein
MEITTIIIAAVGLYLLFKFKVMAVGSKAGETYVTVVENKLDLVEIESEMTHKEELTKLLAKAKEMKVSKDANKSSIMEILNGKAE